MGGRLVLDSFRFLTSLDSGFGEAFEPRRFLLAGVVDGLCVAVVEGLPVLGGHASGLGLANIEAQRRGMACHVTGAFFLAREGSTFIASQLRDGFVHDF